MKSCLVVLSGGQDSTTCLAIAKTSFDVVHAITFDYGQRHRIEIESAVAIAKALEVKTHEVITLGASILLGSSPLVSLNPVGQYDSVDDLPGGVEPTFVPGRNILFAAIAANRAAMLNLSDIFMGVCQEDYGGYFDCRQDFIDTINVAISQGINGDNSSITIHAPLMDLTKGESVTLAKTLLGDRFDEVMRLTHTCYNGVPGGCGKCHACHLRDRGFQDAGIADPLWSLKK